MIANTNNNLILTVAVNEPGSEKCIDVTFVPVIGWSVEEYDELRAWAVGSDNDKDEQAFIFNKDSKDWYLLNKSITGNGKEDLINVINLNRKIEIKI
ncbi:MAG: hypothetical protein COA54_04300 [Thiotrichaceae bacterium]|nr:MAG: hypothetical protein COA54_04300 [Thiotrichaceae bacterium]